MSVDVISSILLIWLDNCDEREAGVSPDEQKKKVLIPPSPVTKYLKMVPAQ
jgi:hypothetical protein